jgi:hypothetical protein
MTSLTVTYTITRNDEDIEIEATGDFYHGELEDFSVEPKIELTADEVTRIEEKLIEAKADDWDEDSWKAERERS